MTHKPRKQVCRGSESQLPLAKQREMEVYHSRRVGVLWDSTRVNLIYRESELCYAVKMTSTFSIRNRKFSCWLPVAQADSCCTVSINTGDKGLLQEPSSSPPSVHTPKTQTVPVEEQWKLKSELHSQEGYPGPSAHTCRPTQIRSWRRSAQLIWTMLRAKHITSVSHESKQEIS